MRPATDPFGTIAELCVGRVFHKRLRPIPHAFSYAVFFLRVPLSQVDRIGNRWFSRNRFNLVSFYDRDYGPRDGTRLDTWMRALLKREGIRAADGDIVLQTFPRLLGYVFNPISVWYCLDRDGRLRAALCEVNNTFGEHHNYLIVHDDQRTIGPGDWLTARKVFHVSPFCAVSGHYRFRFEQTTGRAFTEIDYFDGGANFADSDKLLVTTMHGTPAPLDAASTLRAFFRYPLMTFAVVLRIHTQALRLWLNRLPYFRKPEPPAFETTR